MSADADRATAAIEADRRRACDECPECRQMRYERDLLADTNARLTAECNAIRMAGQGVLDASRQLVGSLDRLLSEADGDVSRFRLAEAVSWWREATALTGGCP